MFEGGKWKIGGENVTDTNVTLKETGGVGGVGGFGVVLLGSRVTTAALRWMRLLG